MLPDIQSRKCKCCVLAEMNNIINIIYNFGQGYYLSKNGEMRLYKALPPCDLAFLINAVTYFT